MVAQGRCEILGPFSLIIQACLGLLAMSSLVWKRYCEYPNRRPWKIWFYDVSKQVFGALGVHVLNIIISILSGQADRFHGPGGHGPPPPEGPHGGPGGPGGPGGFGSGQPGAAYQPHHGDSPPPLPRTSPYYLRQAPVSDNPCDYYFLNILFDTTIGIPILWVLLYSFYHLAKRTGITGIDSGEYGTPPKVSSYLKQLVLYFIGLLSMKLIIYIILMECPFLVEFAMWILSWSDSLPEVQVAFVMMVFPLIMNTFQYYVIDNIIQSPEYYKSNQLLKRQEDTDGPDTLPHSHADRQQRYLEDTADVAGLLGQPQPKQLEGQVLSPQDRPTLKKILTRQAQDAAAAAAAADISDSV